MADEDDDDPEPPPATPAEIPEQPARAYLAEASTPATQTSPPTAAPQADDAAAAGPTLDGLAAGGSPPTAGLPAAGASPGGRALDGVSGHGGPAGDGIARVSGPNPGGFPAEGFAAEGLSPGGAVDADAVGPGVLDLLRAAGYQVTDEGLADARARLERSSAAVTAESRVESRERVREIMGWS